MAESARKGRQDFQLAPNMHEDCLEIVDMLLLSDDQTRDQAALNSGIKM